MGGKRSELETKIQLDRNTMTNYYLGGSTKMSSGHFIHFENKRRFCWKGERGGFPDLSGQTLVNTGLAQRGLNITDN